jgi:glycosidase
LIVLTTGSESRTPVPPPTALSNCLNHTSLYKDTADEETKKLLRANYQAKSRDNARTPMQWSSGHQAGFTSGDKPWMRVNDNYTDINAAAQTSNPKSVYHCYRQVLEKRKALKDLFVYGDYSLVEDGEDNAGDKVFAYKRTSASGETALIACNFSTDTVKWKFEGQVSEVIISPTDKTVKDIGNGVMELGPCEAIAVLL